MRERDEVLREFCPGFPTSIAKHEVEELADRIRELEAQQAASEPVVWCTQDEYGRFGELFATKAEALKHSAEAFPLYAHPSAAAEPVSNAYTLPSTVQAIVDAANAYEQWQGKWYDYTVASGEKPAKQQRALIEAVRKHRAALQTAASEGASDA